MAIIKKKTWPKIFELVKKGKKKFDLRVADFNIREGDTLILEEYDPKKKKHTGRTMRRKAKYVFKFKINDFGQEKEISKNGLYIIQL
jgi:hypothetical protein